MTEREFANLFFPNNSDFRKWKNQRSDSMGDANFFAYAFKNFLINWNKIRLFRAGYEMMINYNNAQKAHNLIYPGLEVNKKVFWLGALESLWGKYYPNIKRNGEYDILMSIIPRITNTIRRNRKYRNFERLNKEDKEREKEMIVARNISKDPLRIEIKRLGLDENSYY